MELGKQVSGARGVLGWSRKDLSKASSVSERAIEELEKGNTDIKESTRTALINAFATEGIEFTAHGLEERKDRILFLNDFLDVLADVENTLKKGEECLLHCASETRNTPEVTKRFRQLAGKKIGLRFTLCEGDNIMTTDSANYRWIDSEYFASSEVSVIYADRYVRHVVDHGKDIFIIIRNQTLADVGRRQFEYFWRNAKPCPDGKNTAL